MASLSAPSFHHSLTEEVQIYSSYHQIEVSGRFVDSVAFLLKFL